MLPNRVKNKTSGHQKRQTCQRATQSQFSILGDFRGRLRKRFCRNKAVCYSGYPERTSRSIKQKLTAAMAAVARTGNAIARGGATRDAPSSPARHGIRLVPRPSLNRMPLSGLEPLFGAVPVALIRGRGRLLGPRLVAQMLTKFRAQGTLDERLLQGSRQVLN